MKVYVNDTEIEIFEGANVKDAVRKYFTLQDKKMPRSLKYKDKYDNEIDADGSLTESSTVFVEVKSRKKRRGSLKFFLIFLVLNLFLVSCNANVEKTKSVSNDSIYTVKFLAVNDIHANIDLFPKLSYLVDSLRKQYPELILLSGGDNQTGNPANDQYETRGLPMIELMNALKFKASAVGNHEFDVGQETFGKLMKVANFDFLSANYRPKNKEIEPTPYKIIELSNGVKVGVLGLIQLNRHGIPDSHPDNLKDIKFYNPLKSFNHYAFVRDMCDVFVALTHLGFEEDVKLAESMQNKKLDLIIGGHSHTTVSKKQVVNGALITQAGSKLRYATLIDVKVKNGKVVDKEMQLIDLRNIKKENPLVQKMVDKYNDNPYLKRVLATLQDDLPNVEYLGYLMTDASREMADVDIVLQNPGGVRLSFLKKGNITIKDVYNLDPFGNELIVLNLTGKELYDMLFAAFVMDNKKPSIPSGLKVTATIIDNDLKKMELFDNNGEPIKMNSHYRVGMNSYMVSAYNFKHKDPGTSTSKTTASLLIEYLEKHKTIPSYKNEKRIIVVP